MARHMEHLEPFPLPPEGEYERCRNDRDRLLLRIAELEAQLATSEARRVAMQEEVKRLLRGK